MAPLSACGGTATDSLFGREPSSGSGGGWSPPSSGGFTGASGNFGSGGTEGLPRGGSGNTPPLGAGGSGVAVGSGGSSFGGSNFGGNGGDGVGGSSTSSGGAAVDGGDPLSNLPPHVRDISKCDFTGTWASYVTVPVSWPGAPFVLLQGSGTIKQWTLSHRVQDSLLELHESVVACSIFLPDLTGSVLTSNQKFGIRFPNSIFDSGTAPPWDFKTKASISGDQVLFTTEPVATLTGVTLASPATDTWPAPPTGTQLRDDDNDQNPGVTVMPVDPATDASYNFPPVGLPQFLGDYPRAGQIFIASRSVATLRGTVDSCDSLSGSVDIATLGGVPAINSSVVGCVRTDGQVCVDSEASFLDQNRPQFVPSGPGTLKSVRMPDGATCADVRARFPN